MSIIKWDSKIFHDISKKYGIDKLLCSGCVEQSIDLVNSELTVDTLDFTAHSESLVAKNYPSELMTFNNGSYMMLYSGDEELFLGRWYVRSADHVYPTSKIKYQLISPIGILAAAPYHGGGIYTGQTVSTVLSSIFSGTGLTYTVASEVGSIKLYGRLKRAERRKNLAEILIATGASCLFDASTGNISIRFLSEGNANTLPAGRVYLKGNGIQNETAYTSVAITEHAFLSLSSDPLVTLYDNTATMATASKELVVFENPCHNLAVTGNLVINESNANYAVVSGVGTLTGREYTHTTRIITKSTGLSGTSNVKTIEDVEVITQVNSDYVAQRVAKYFGAKKSFNLSLVLGSDTRLGDKISFSDLFGAVHTGYIRSLKYNLNPEKVKASANMLEGWTPGPYGSNITAYEVVTSNKTWTRPANIVGGITVVLIGGGQGGQGGTGGSGGKTGSGSSNGDGGAAGGVGSGGSGGKVYQFTIESPAASYAIVIGQGGAGGAGGDGGSANNDGNAGSLGSAGGNTTFGSYSSASGAPNANGIQNAISGDVYAIAGLAGLYSAAAGGAGGKDGGNYSSWIGGGAGAYKETSTAQTKRYSFAAANGGGGGGAAYGSNGGDGGDGSVHGPVYDASDLKTGYMEGYGGVGGVGAEPSAPSSSGLSNRGAGGRGGNGGGGGGGGGAANGQGWTRAGAGGKGGNGSSGSAGNPGVVIIYYRLSA